MFKIVLLIIAVAIIAALTIPSIVKHFSVGPANGPTQEQFDSLKTERDSLAIIKDSLMIQADTLKKKP
jgi:hypothetical protein